jgi:hypothetical protein
MHNNRDDCGAPRTAHDHYNCREQQSSAVAEKEYILH